MKISALWHDKIFYRKLVGIAFPVAMQSLMLSLVAAADAAMLGKVSQDAMAAVSLATQIQFVQNMVLGAIVAGIGILGAQYWGKHDCAILEKILGGSIRESVIVSLFFFAGCLLIPELLMKLFAGDPILIQLGADYLKVAGWSYLLSGVSQCYLAVMRVSDRAGCSAWISSGAVVLNIVLNAVFIFGWCGVPAMGVKGAALATVLARVLELAACMIASEQRSFIHLKVKAVFGLDKLLVRDFWRYSLPVLGSYLLWGIGFTAYTAIIGHLGRDAAAANSIAAVVRDLICCVCNGLAAGSGIVIGNELGAGNLALGKAYGRRTMVLSFVCGCANTAVILALIPVITHFIKLTPLAQEYMTGMFVILSVYMIGRCVCTVVINGIFSAGGDTLFDIYSLAVCMWCFALPCAFLSAFYLHWPVLVAYACTCLDEVGKIPWVMHHFFKYKWVKNITRA